MDQAKILITEYDRIQYEQLLFCIPEFDVLIAWEIFEIIEDIIDEHNIETFNKKYLIPCLCDNIYDDNYSFPLEKPTRKEILLAVSRLLNETVIQKLLKSIIKERNQ